MPTPEQHCSEQAAAAVVAAADDISVRRLEAASDHGRALRSEQSVHIEMWNILQDPP